MRCRGAIVAIVEFFCQFRFVVVWIPEKMGDDPCAGGIEVADAALRVALFEDADGVVFDEIADLLKGLYAR